MKSVSHSFARAAAAIACVCVATFSQVSPPPAPATPAVRTGKLTPSEVTHAAGEILRGEVVSHTFVLTNTGSGDVTINEVRACCTCTSAAVKLAGKSLTAEETAKCKQIGTLKPGDRAELTFALDTLDAGCGGKDGPITKFVNVYHTDASTSPLSLSIAGELVTPYRIDPPRLDFGTVKAGAIAKASCVVTSDRLGEFKVLSAACAAEELVKVTFARETVVTAPNVAYRVEAELLPTARAGAYYTSVALKLDHAHVRAIVIPLCATARAECGSE
jgi:hypothetical protein